MTIHREIAESYRKTGSRIDDTRKKLFTQRRYLFCQAAGEKGAALRK